MRGKWDEAEAVLLDQMAKKRHLGDLKSLSFCLKILANIYRVSGRLQEASGAVRRVSCAGQ